MKIADKLRSEPRTFSFEFFPPRTPAARARFFDAAKRLRGLQPSFVSVTYGAGGSTRIDTIELTTRLRDELDLTAMAHLTCVGHSRAELEAIFADLVSRGIENTMLLRGDPPSGESRFEPAPDGFRNAWELVRLAREVGNFSIGVAGYPEGHQECSDRDLDLRHLKEKVDSGADFVVTQLFFDNADYFSFVERARAAGIDVRLIPGIMPVTNGPQIRRIATMCGASIPPALGTALDGAGDDPVEAARIGTDWAKRQCEDLLHGGAPGIHFYTLNQSRATLDIFEHLRNTGELEPGSI